jgi:hypothetical protein
MNPDGRDIMIDNLRSAANDTLKLIEAKNAEIAEECRVKEIWERCYKEECGAHEREIGEKGTRIRELETMLAKGHPYQREYVEGLRRELAALKEKLGTAVNIITSIASLVEWSQRWQIPFTIEVKHALGEATDHES